MIHVSEPLLLCVLPAPLHYSHFISAGCEKSTCWDLKHVLDIDFHGELNYRRGLNAAESRDCLENSLRRCLQGRSDIWGLRGDRSAAAFKFTSSFSRVCFLFGSKLTGNTRERHLQNFRGAEWIQHTCFMCVSRCCIHYWILAVVVRNITHRYYIKTSKIKSKYFCFTSQSDIKVIAP